MDAMAQARECESAVRRPKKFCLTCHNTHCTGHCHFVRVELTLHAVDSPSLKAEGKSPRHVQFTVR